MISDIRLKIAECKVALSAIGNGTVFSNMDVGPNTRRFIAKMKEFCNLLPESENMVKSCINKNLAILESNKTIHPFAFGETKAMLLSLEARIGSLGGRKLFISHSTSDRAIVQLFVDKILQLGSKIASKDIFCTSIEELGIKNGQEMRKHIEANILGCDIAILLLSRAYNKSPICLNEMGAVWCSPFSEIRVLTLPDIRIPESVGWLLETKQADRLDSEAALDALHESLIRAYSLPEDLVAWGRHKRDFLNSLPVSRWRWLGKVF